MKHVAGTVNWGRIAVLLAGAASIGLTRATRGEPLPAGQAQVTVNQDATARADAEATALNERLFKQAPDEQDRAAAIVAVLAYQGDASKPWTRAWADLLARVQTERVKLGGGLTPAQEERIVKQAVRPVAVARPAALCGEFLPIVIQPGTVRLATGASVVVRAVERDWRIETAEKPRGVILQERQVVAVDSDEYHPLLAAYREHRGKWELAGPVSGQQHDESRSRPPQPRPLSTGVFIPSDTPLGLATVRLEVDIVHLTPESKWSHVKMPSKPAALTVESIEPGTATLSIPIRIVNRPEEVIEARELAGEELEKFTAALKPDNVEVGVMESFTTFGPATTGRGHRSVAVEMTLGGLSPTWPNLDERTMNREVPEGVAFEIWVVESDREVVVGALASPSLGDQLHLYQSRGRSRQNALWVPKGTSVTVRLVPYRRVAESNPTATWYHAGVIEFKNVPVVISDVRSEKLEPLDGLVDTSGVDTFMPEPGMPRIPFKTPGNHDKKAP